ncbi:MAG TPA: response regulator [Pseudolabrys sp.]|nr:response regulator [Pseudolabrys sp.]
MSTRRTNVLVVEDEVLISEMVSDVLSENGFKVHTVTSGETALRYLESSPEVDVLFTDINLEGRMDGSTLAKAARERRPDLPIVYCSGRYSSSAIMPLMPRSIFVKKPYDLDDLCTLLTRLTNPAH